MRNLVEGVGVISASGFLWFFLVVVVFGSFSPHPPSHMEVCTVQICHYFVLDDIEEVVGSIHWTLVVMCCYKTNRSYMSA